MNPEKISRVMSYALRHDPAKFSIVLDNEGWVDLDKLFIALNPEANGIITIRDVRRMIATSKKKRFDLDEKNGRIRAYYGHSIKDKITKPREIPPAVLFQGTSRRSAESIKFEGIKPMSRQYAHLSTDIETALSVGRRHDKKPVVLVIHASKAHRNGTKFYHGNEDVWLTDFVHQKYIINFDEVNK